MAGDSLKSEPCNEVLTYTSSGAPLTANRALSIPSGEQLPGVGEHLELLRDSDGRQGFIVLGPAAPGTDQGLRPAV